VDDTQTKRAYDSSRRRSMAAANRAAVFAAAADLFATRGWAGTSMRDVAKSAGVSVETVYSLAGGKTDLLLATIDIGIVGDDRPVPLAERAEFLALGRGTRTDRIEAAAELVASSNLRIAALNRTFSQAATADESLAARWYADLATQRAAYADGMTLVLGAPPHADVIDGIWAIGSSEVYLQLTAPPDRGGAGWSTEKYRQWLADRIDQLLPEETS